MDTKATSGPASGERHFGLDWLRSAAFALLILHHIGCVFVSGDWLVKLDHLDWLALPMLLVTPWRLALLFLIAGFASHMLCRRLGNRAFLKERTMRLLIPLFAAMILIIPPQSWVRLTLSHDYAHSFGHFLAHDAFRFGSLDGVTLPAWEHLWFVAYLWVFTIVAAAGAAMLPPTWAARLAHGAEALTRGRRLFWVPLLYFVPVRAGVAFTFGESHGLFDDWVAIVIYFPAFLLGFVLAGRTGLWNAVARSWRPALLVAIGSFLYIAAVEMLYPALIKPPRLIMALDRAAMGAMMWCAILVMLRLADTALNRDHPWRRRLSEAVFPFYIIHQTIIVVVAWALLGSDLTSPAAFLFLLAATISGCWLFYRLGDLFPAVRPLIGLKRRPATRKPAPILPSPSTPAA